MRPRLVLPIVIAATALAAVVAPLRSAAPVNAGAPLGSGGPQAMVSSADIASALPGQPPLHYKSRLGLMPPAYGAAYGAPSYMSRQPSAQVAYLSPYTTAAVGSWPQVLALADLTGDGYNDAAVATANYFDPANDDKLHVFAHAGNLIARTQILTAGANPESTLAADLNVDGRADVALALAGEDAVAIYTQTAGSGLVVTPLLQTVAGAPNALASGDFDGDLRPDLAAIAPQSGTIRLWKSNTEGLAPLPFNLPYPTGGYDALAAGDLDNDGDDDLAALRGAGYSSGSVVIYWQENGSFPLSTTLTPESGGYLPHSLAVGDVNGDGRDDLLVTAGGNAPEAYLNVFLQEAGGPAAAPSVYPAYHLPSAVAVGDLNHDGREDVVVLHDAWQTLGVFTQTVSGTLAAYDTAAVPYSDRYRPDALDLADLDGNGGLDVALVDRDHGLVILTNTLTALTAVIHQPAEAAVLSPGAFTVTGATSAGTVKVEARLRGYTDWMTATLAGNSWQVSLTLPVKERAWWIEARALDAQGHFQAPTTRRRIGIEAEPPSGQISINDGAPATNQTAVTLTLPAYDMSGVAAMRFSADGVYFSDWVSYSLHYTGTLTPASDGLKTLYAQFRDVVGKDSALVSDTILLDTQRPSSAVAALPATVLQPSFDLSWTGQDNSSGVAHYDIQAWDSHSSAWQNLAQRTSLTQTVFTGQDETTYCFRSRATDRAGNVEAWPVGQGDTCTTVQLEYGVDVIPSQDVRLGHPGQAVTYTLYVKNLGSAADTYDLSLGAHAWEATLLTAAVGPVEPDSIASFQVRVSIPAGATEGSSEALDVAATSQAEPSASISSTLTTVATSRPIVYGLTLVPPTGIKVEHPGQVVTYTLCLENTGTVSDSYTLSLEGYTWPAELSTPVIVSLAPGQRAGFELYVTIPSQAAGQQDGVRVTATSQGDTALFDTSDLTTLATRPVRRGISLSPLTAGAAGGAGSTLLYTLAVTNTGTLTDTLTLEASGNAWDVAITPRGVTLPGQAGASIAVNVTIPPGAVAGLSDTVTVQAYGMGGSAAASLTTSASSPPAARQVAIAPPAAAKTGSLGQAFTYALQVENRGNVPDGYTLTLSAGDWPAALSSDTIAWLEPGEAAGVEVSTTIPYTATPGDSRAIFVTATSQHNSSVYTVAELTTTAHRPEPIQRGVDIAPRAVVTNGYTGGVVHYNLVVTNAGSITDTLTLSPSGNAWEAEITPSSVTLSSTQAVTVVVGVTVPPDVMTGTHDVVTIQADGSGASASAVLTTTAQFATVTRGASVSPPTAAKSRRPGQEAVYTLEVQNTGNVSDSFSLALGNSAWASVLPAGTSGVLDPGDTVSFQVRVTISNTASDGESDTVVVSATSDYDAAAYDTASITTYAVTQTITRSVTLTPAAAAQDGHAGQVVVYQLTLTNTSSVTDTIALSLSGNAWHSALTPALVTLPTGAQATVAVNVTIPATATAGASDTVTVTASASGASASSVLTTSVPIVRGTDIAPHTASLAGAPGQVLTYSLRVKNTGNAPDRYSLTVGKQTWPAALSASTSGQLAPGETSEFELYASVPAGANDGESDTAVVTATSDYAGGSVTATLTTFAITQTITRGVDIASSAPTQGGGAGQTIVYPLTVVNTGTVTDAIVLDVIVIDAIVIDGIVLGTSNSAWQAVVEPAILSLPSMGSASAAVNVTIPETVTTGTSITFSVQAAASGATDWTVLTTTVTSQLITAGVSIAPSTAVKYEYLGQGITLALVVENTGNAADSFDLAVEGDWPAGLSAGAVGPLDPGKTASLEVYATVAGDALEGQSGTISVTAMSQHDPRAYDTSTLTAIAVQPPAIQRGVAITPGTAHASGSAGSVIAYRLTLANTGDVADTIALSASGNSWQTEITPASITLPGGGETSVVVSVTIPAAATLGMSDVVSIQAVGSGASASAVLTTTANSPPIVADLDITPPSSAKVEQPGQRVTHTLYVRNAGNAPDSFDLTLSSHTWPAALSTSLIGPLKPGEMARIQVYVTLPGSVLPGTSDALVLTAASQRDTGVWANASLTTAAFRPKSIRRGITLTPPAATGRGTPGSTVSYALALTNTGEVTDTIVLCPGCNAWETAMSPLHFTLPSLGHAALVVSVTVPATATTGMSNTVRAVATGSGASASAVLTTLADTTLITCGVAIAPATFAQSGNAGDVVVYHLAVTNTGNAVDVITLTPGGNTWDTALVPTQVTLPSLGSSPVVVSVTIPLAAPGGQTDVVTVTAHASDDASAVSILTTSALTPAMYSLELTPASAQGSGDNGDTLVYTFTVRNTGDASDSYNLSLSGDEWPTNLSSDSLGPLAAGATATFRVEVTIPPSALADAFDQAAVRVQSAANAAVFGTSTFTTTVLPRFAMRLEPPTASLMGNPARTVTYTLVLHNDGNVADTYSLITTPAAWATVLATDTLGPLPAGGQANMEVYVTIPSTAIDGNSDSVTVTATSLAEPSASDQSVLTTVATTQIVTRGVALAPQAAAQSGQAGDVVIYHLTVTNTGSTTDTITLSDSGGAWVTTIDPGSVTLPSLGSRPVTVSVTVPLTATGGQVDVVTITAQASEGVYARSTLTTSVPSALEYVVYLPVVMKNR